MNLKHFCCHFIAALVVLILVTACTPEASSTQIPIEAGSSPTVEPSPIVEPTIVSSATPIVAAGPLEFKGHTADVWSVDISPDGKSLVTASDDKTARLWDLATGQTLQVFSPCTLEQGGARFSPDGKSILVGCMDHTAYLIDIASGQTLQTFSAHTGGVDWVDFAPDGKRCSS